jgi:hypothetical protein
VLKKNASEPGISHYDYAKGFAYYEELRPYLLKYPIGNKVYAMGMNLVLQFGLRHFLDKFKRKEIVSRHTEKLFSPAPVALSNNSIPIFDGNARELIFILAQMIQSTGDYHGTKQKDFL